MLTYESFVRDQQKTLLAIAWVLTGDTGHAEDLVQDTLVRAYLKWHLIEGADHPHAYVRKVLLNIWRARRRRREIFVAEVPDGRWQDDDRWQQQALVAALRRLTPMERAAVALRHADDLSTLQTARVLNCSEASVRTHSLRALTKLRRDRELAGVFSDEWSES